MANLPTRGIIGITTMGGKALADKPPNIVGMFFRWFPHWDSYKKPTKLDRMARDFKYYMHVIMTKIGG